MMIQAFELSFIATVPAGHLVTVAFLSNDPEGGKEQGIVFDQTTKTVYCDELLFGALGHNNQVTDDPLAVLARFTWRIVRQASGVSHGAVVGSKSWGEMNFAGTRLFVEVR